MHTLRRALSVASLASLALAACGPRSGAPTKPATLAPLEIRNEAGQALSGDPEAGRQVFLVCSACHSLTPGQNMVGPSLHGVIGRRAGTAPGFQYSTANRNSGLTWSEQELYVYLEDPQKTVPGTYMTYTGLKDSQKRADLIAYLAQATK